MMGAEAQNEQLIKAESVDGSDALMIGLQKDVSAGDDWSVAHDGPVIAQLGGDLAHAPGVPIDLDGRHWAAWECGLGGVERSAN
jgi:hypothetical protein